MSGVVAMAAGDGNTAHKARRGGHMAQSDDAGTSAPSSTAVADVFPTHNVGKPEVREMPAEPKQYWRLIGPGIIAAGVGLASGEFILYPYIASQVGLVFVWAALVGLATQFFLNMEIERYTLATGGDRPDRIQPVLAALGPSVRHPHLLRQPVARLGNQLGHPDQLPLRRRGDLDRDRHPARRRVGLDSGPRGVHRAGAGPDAQGGPGVDPDP